MPEIQLNDFFKYYSDTVEQKEAVQLLQSAMPTSLLRADSAWVVKYREQPPESEAALSNPLSVPYDCQLDNPGTSGWRECFSSSCAMVAMYWGVIQHQNEYHQRRPKYGDSTDASAQIRTLESFGLKARFVQVGSADKLKAQIDRGRPAPVGYLHHGTPQNPSGGGHYCCAIGYNDTGFIMNDPYGECNLVNGTWAHEGGTWGKGVVYSYKNWVPRWSVSNDHDGWGLDIWKP